jgi:hypothetical protein
MKHYVICDNKCLVESYTKNEIDEGFTDVLNRVLLGFGVLLPTDFSNKFKSNTATELPYVETVNGTNFTSMYNGCLNLTKLQQPLNILDTRNGTDFRYMFSDCKVLEYIPKLDTRNGTNFSFMFKNCNKLKSVPEGLDTSSAGEAKMMFYKCSSLTTIPDLNTSKIYYFNGMFSGCTNIVDVPDLDLSSMADTGDMFYNCTSLTTFRDNPLLNGVTPWQFSDDIYFNSCPLDRTSILKVFNGLKTVSGKTIGISSTTNSYLSEEDKAIATAKGWTITVDDDDDINEDDLYS